jgi:uncharacterized protein
VDENTIVIGHSSGAEAAMRYMESNKVYGCILVCACHTDLGYESEAAAGYYNRPWKWEVIKANSRWILQYHSSDDPFIPQHEADFVAAQLGSEYKLARNKSHFFRPKDVAELVTDLAAKLSTQPSRPQVPAEES